MQQASPSPSDNRRPLRILIVRLSAHGDVMHTLPLLTAIKQADPEAHVGWLVERSAVSLLENHPLIDAMHVSDRKRWLKACSNPLNWPAVWNEVLALIQALRREHYAVSFDVQGLLKSAIWPFLVGIPSRYGFFKTRENADVFYTHKLPPMNIRDPKTPAVERYLDFAREVGYTVSQPAFSLPPVSEHSRKRVDELLAPLPKGAPLVILAPFTRWASKHWIPEYWAQLANGLLQDDLSVAVIGSPEDHAAAAELMAALSVEKQKRVLNLAGQTDWPDLYALFERSRLLIGLDSAPLHIANAVGLEVIGIYGPTAPGRTGPIGDRQRTLATALSCQPCFEYDCPIRTHDCMRQLAPEAVLASARQVLALDEAVNA